MIERFQGEDGRRLLTEVLCDLGIVNGNETVAAKLTEVAQLHELESGDVLITQDAEDNDIFLIVSGSLTIEVNGRPVATRNAGTHVGEMALIDPKARRSATVLAAERSVVAKVTQPALSRLANDTPDLWRRISVELCDRLRNRNRLIRRPNEVPNVLICSSAEKLLYAEGIQLGLDHHNSSVSVWTDQVFGPMKQTMEDLEREVCSADFGVAVVMDEDVTRSRKEQKSSPRDNVIFELGLFMGQLGRERTVIVSPRNIDLKMPSDLLGLNPLTFLLPTDPADPKQLATAFGPVCTQLKTLFNQLGPR
ncbi:nucleotide-binding protein [Stieleria sp. TO1_6]|uniref:TIR domain-containing protein n=1 Tax=Stieleria tagensis TaxID=2956795 RepID=UPI00209A8BAB|nr:TIR domain-containing protein [Stieleria tagensis]MCO8125130.1 nucleotide-binding protein [Stieleria tagensis]